VRGHHYLVPGALTNWANEAIARDQLPKGSIDPEPGRLEPRANPGPANEASQPEEGRDSDALLVALNGASWDVSGTEDGPVGSVGMSSSAGGE